MEKTNEEKRDKFLLLFVPKVTPQTDVFVCCSITVGNQFISIVFLLISATHFFNSLYTKNLTSIFHLVYSLIYCASGCFLLFSTFTQNYIFAKISYILYQILFFIRMILYLLAFIGNIVSIFIYMDPSYILRIFGVLLAAGIELGIMSYFIFVIYCFLVVNKDVNNDINRIGAEYQELLKDYKEFK
jgi:hypothetical protein